MKESLTSLIMKKLNMGRQEFGFWNLWIIYGKIFVILPKILKITECTAAKKS